MKKIVIALVALLALSGIASALGYGNDDGASSVASGDKSAGTASRGGTLPSGDESDPIRPEASDEFAALLAGPARGDEIAAFSHKNLTKTVEFDGYVERIYWDDYYADVPSAIVRSGESNGSLAGPRFSIDAESSNGARLKKGQRVHVTGVVGAYEHDEADDTFTEATTLMRLNLIDTKVDVEG